MGRKFGKNKLEMFKQLFLDRRNKLIDSIVKNSNQEIDVDGDEIDVIQGKVLNNVNSMLSRRDVELLERVDNSIQKIDDGSFGACEECDERIGEKRLIAIPGCYLCIECAEKEENDARHYQNL